MRILFADDHPLFREGVKPVLHKLSDEIEIIEANDYPTAFETAGNCPDLDLALLDLYMPGMPGLDGIARFRSVFPQIPVVVLSASDERDNIQHLLSKGALGYICKSSPSDVILSALRLILAGGIYIPQAMLDGTSADADRFMVATGKQEALTRRQAEVLRELAKGLNNKQIAHNLNVTEGTIKIHLATIFRVLNVNSRTEALLQAQKMGFSHPS
jgi:DNA-binding NarL/FixJ family response regulator